MIDPLDDDIRGLIATERDRAPLPLPWEEIVARTDRRAALRRRPLLLAAAALLAVGLLGLVAIAVTRAVDQEPADTPPTPSTTIPVTPTTVTSTVEAKDRLVGLTDSDWVVPGELPAGYIRLVASVTGFDDNASLQIFGDADGGSRVWLRVGESGSESDDGEAIVIDGVTWQRHTFAPIEEVGEFVDLVRSVNGRSVTLQSVGNPGVLEQFARVLVVVPGDEIDFEYLDPSGRFTDVVTIDADADAVTLGVIGLNGYYCWKIDLESGVSGSGACEFTTTPDHPVLELGSLSAPGGSYTAGLAEQNVDRIDWETAGGAVVSVVPVDESGQFDQRFWIVAGLDLGSLPSAVGMTVQLDDGSIIDLERTPLGDWSVPAGE